MRILQKKSLNLQAPRFLVDKPLNQEVEKFDVMSHLNRSSATAIVGTSGSGKTSLLYSLLTHRKPNIWRKQFESIIVVMPRASRNSLKNNIFDKFIEPECLFDTLDDLSMDYIVARTSDNSEQGLHTLIVLDDVASALKDAEVAKKLQHLVYAYRHYRANIVVLVQTLRTIPLSIRKNLSNVIVFHKPRLVEWEAVVSEFLELEKEPAKQLYTVLFQNKYDWALINLQTGKVYKKFDEVLYRDAT